MPRILRPALLILALLLPAACAQSPGGSQQAAAAPDPTDPLEPTNRQVLDFNLRADECCIRPVAEGYRAAVHPWVRTRIRNVIANIDVPRHAANALLQGEPLVAATNVMRFVINSTLGIGGMFDLAEIGGPPRQPRDFGQTLYRWGVEDGPYLMLPIVGPNNPRDLAGSVADGFMNPISWFVPFWGNLLRSGVDGVDVREQNIETLDALRADSLDFYARLRSVWQQRRDAELGRTGRAGQDPSVLDDPEAAPPRPVSPRTEAAPAAEAPRAEAVPAEAPRAAARTRRATTAHATRTPPRSVATARRGEETGAWPEQAAMPPGGLRLSLAGLE